MTLCDVPIRIAGGPERHRIIRRGQREPISALARFGVIRRDGNTCKACGLYLRGSTRSTQLDHIVPWSAGGSDATDNLRVLCNVCNNARSNFRDDAESSRVLPVTWWCGDCWTSLDAHERYHADRGETCWLQSMTGLEWAEEWVREPFFGDGEALRVLAYCAHCDTPGYAERVL